MPNTHVSVKRARAKSKCSKCERIKKRKVITDAHELDNREAFERYVLLMA